LPLKKIQSPKQEKLCIQATNKMREVAVFLTPDLYKANPHLIESLGHNLIAVHSFDVHQENYRDAIEWHQQVVSEEIGKDLSSAKLCLAFENSREGVVAAYNAGMSVIGIGQNKIELERFKSYGAHAVALSVSDLLDNFGIETTTKSSTYPTSFICAVLQQ